MKYKKKAALLSVLVAALAIANILTYVFDPAKQRSASFAWLDSSLVPAADRIEIRRSANLTPGGAVDSKGGEKIVLLRKNNRWIFQGENSDLPVKQARVEDLLAALSRRALYPKRAASSEARALLALEEERSSRIVIGGGSGLPLLDLLIGSSDALGKEVYFRKAGQNEIYSGEDLFTVYTESTAKSWYDLKLFSLEAGDISIDAVQQAEISLSGEDAGIRSFMLRRQRGGWAIPGDENTVLDSQKIDAWLRTVLEAEAEDFGTTAPVKFEKTILLYLGNGSTRSIKAGVFDGKKLAAMVSGSNLVYILPEWASIRLFREAPYFSKAE